MGSLKFKKGLEKNLPKEIEKDIIYITTDTKKILLNDAVWEDTENIKKIINENEKVTNASLTQLKEIINEDEKVISSSLTNLNKLTNDNEKNISLISNDLLNKVDKVDGKQLSTEDFTTALKNKLNSLTNYNDNEITNRISDLEENLNAIVNANPSTAINNFNEIIAFLKNIEDSEDLDSIIASIEKQIYNILEQVNENEFVTANSLTELNEQIIKTPKLFNISYSELVNLKDESNLIPNSIYRITDYTTTTIQEGTQSANHPFDIIVKALSNNILSEDAKAILHDGDKYFANNDLSSWEIKYCLDNDTTRFAWADTSNGKGVIYYMKDEFNNECWYDFKNIQFLRTTNFFNTNSFLTHLEGDNYYFTFSNIVNNEIIDGTIYNENITVSIQNKIDKINGTKYSLNNTIFINDNSGYTRYNVIGFGNNNNTFGTKCQANTILQHCYNNVVSNMFRNNIIAQYFCNNRVSGQFEYNTLGIQCYNNDFSGYIWFTTFGSQFNYCSFNILEGFKLEYCEFGSGIGFLNGIPAIKKVTFEDNVAWYDTTTWVSNLETVDGRTLEEAITIEHDDQLYVSKVGDKYDVNSLHNIKKNINDNILIPIYSNPNLDFESTSNNSNCHGYVGTLDAVNVKGDLILIDSIGVYIREGKESPNLNTPVWCRVLRFNNNTWEIVYQSVESKIINGVEPETLFSFKMKDVDSNKLIKSTDKIAIVYADAEDADVFSSVQIGVKAIIGTSGGLSSALTNESTGVTNWCPAFVVGYLSMADTPKNVVTIENAQTITGKKQFNNGINISNKSFITSSIDPGELKVLHNNSSKGFILRTRNTNDSILPLELLSTNGSASYQYNFQNKNGTVAHLDDINTLESNFNNSLNNIKNIINENEKVTANALFDLNSSIKTNTNKISELESKVSEYTNTIDELRSSVSGNTNTLNSQSARLQTIDSTINLLLSRIEALEKISGDNSGMNATVDNKNNMLIIE